MPGFARSKSVFLEFITLICFYASFCSGDGFLPNVGSGFYCLITPMLGFYCPTNQGVSYFSSTSRCYGDSSFKSFGCSGLMGSALCGFSFFSEFASFGFGIPIFQPNPSFFFFFYSEIQAILLKFEKLFNESFFMFIL